MKILHLHLSKATYSAFRLYIFPCIIMASTSKAFRRCVDPCPRYLTPDDTHDCCVFCLGEGHVRDVLDGAICVHCELFSMRKLRSRLSLFSSKEGQPSASRDSRPTVAEARRRMKLWVSQVDLADELERELSLSHESARNEGEPLDHDDAISLTSSDRAASALLGYAQEEQEMAEGEEVETELSQISCPAYKELLEVMEHATVRLDLPYGNQEDMEGSLELGVYGRGDISMSDTFLAINAQFERAFHFFLISIRRSRRNGKSRFPLASIDSSIPVMLT